MAYLFDVSTESAKRIFGESISSASLMIQIDCNIDNGCFDQSAITIYDPMGHAPEVFFERRSAPNSATGGLWRHFTAKVSNADGRKPLFKLSRLYRDNGVHNLTIWRCVYTQDFSTWVSSDPVTLAGGSTGSYNFSFPSPLPAGDVVIAHNIYGRQQEADAFAQYLLVNNAAIASPADPSYTDGVYARSIVENGDLGQPVGDHPRYAIKLQWPASTTDGQRKRKLVVMYGIHSAGEGQAWWSFVTSIKWLIDSSDLAAQNLRANWDVYLYFNVNPNGIKAGTSRATPRNNYDPNRNWSGLGSVSSLEEVDTLKRVIYANVDGHCDAFYSWHGDVYSTSNFQTWVWTQDYSAATRGPAMQAMLTAGAAIWGIPAFLSTSSTNNTDVWFGREILKAPISFDTETPSMSGSSVAYFEDIGQKWMQTLEVVDQAGQILGTETISAIPAIIGLTGVSASVRDTVTALATPATIGLSGVGANLRLSESIHAKPAIIGLTGTRSTLLLREAIQAKPAVISLTGVTSSISMTGAIEIPAKPATISISGVNASINLSGQIQIYAKPATVTLVPRSVTFAQNAVVNAQPDALVMQPVRSGIYAGEAVVDATAQALTLSPAQATIVQHAVLATTADNIALHGSQAGLHSTNVIATNKANASLYGAQARLYSTEILSGKPASIILQDKQSLIQSIGAGIDTWPANIGIFGQKADIAMSAALAATPAIMIFSGLSAQINMQSPLVWGSTTIEARLQGMTIEARQ